MAISLLLLLNRQPSLADARYGYQAGGGHRLLSAASALGIAAGVGATLVLALAIPTLAPVLPDPPMVVRNVPLATPVEAPPPDQPQREQQRDHRITVPPMERLLPPLGAGPLAPPAQSDLTPPDPLPPADDGVEPVRAAEPVLLPATRDPRRARDFQPDYPPALQREGLEGQARVRVHIGADGRVLAVEDAGSTAPAFFEATRRQALRAWRFRPAMRDGVAVDSWQVLTVHFRITR